MKHLTLIIHTNVQQDMTDQLRNLRAATCHCATCSQQH
jgi:hypothetical protein